VIPPGPASVARSTAAMTALTALSRATGFARIVVVAAVLGTTYLGNTYQSANTVPNLVFELFAAGALQAVLLPTLVEAMDRRDQREAEHVAGSLLGLAAAGLAALAVVGMALAPWLMRALMSGVEPESVREAQVRLGTFFLWFFLPQVVLYAAGMVATGVLHARGRFALPAFAPVLNNVVVTVAYGLFWWLRDGREPSLDLRTAEKAVLAGGTTLGVVALTALPVAAVARSGFSLRPRLDHRHPLVRRVARLSGWAALYLAMSQVLLAAVLVLANRVEGGVVAYQVAFTFFLLPHGLFSIPVFTALYPRLARQAQAEDWDGYRRSVARGVWALAFFARPATAAFCTLAGPLSRTVLFGATGGAGSEQVARALAAFAPGLLGYGARLLLARAFTALGDTRTPALVNVGVAAAGAVGMAIAFAAAPPEWRVAALAGVHSAVHLAGAAVLVALLGRRLPGRRAPVEGRRLAGPALAAALGAVAAWVACAALDGSGRGAAAVSLAAGGVALGAVYLWGQRLLGGPRPAELVALARGRGEPA
jgi:putative peptidoglycan lipid II flippase